MQFWWPTEETAVMRQLLIGISLVLALAAPAAAQDGATATLIDRDGRRVGTATLAEGPHGVLLTLRLEGLPAGPHGLHFHTTGTCDDAAVGFKAAHAHVNPDGREHGLMNPAGPDDGDLPNVQVAADGTAEVEIFTVLVSLSGAEGRALLLDDDGAALLVHANADDHVTQPIGGAGDRIACGVIEAQ